MIYPACHLYYNGGNKNTCMNMQEDRHEGSGRMTLETLLGEIQPVDESAMEQAGRRWDAIAKPLNSLGLLEDAVVRMSGILGTPDVITGKKAVVVMCADNGVVAEDVTQTGQEITAIVAENMTTGSTCVCQMSAVAGADVIPVDMGCCRPLKGRVLNRCVRPGGTANMTQGPAMTREECVQAILHGAELVQDLKEQGYGLIATGEMGIGNTTTSSALISVLLNQLPAQVTGRGAGLSSQGLERKVAAIEKAIRVNCPDETDPLDVLHKVGGLDIAGLVGVFLGGAAYRVPVLIDGIISAAAALVAVHLCPKVSDYLIASHVSKEPAGEMVLKALGLKPFLRAELCLGEGSGAVAVIPLIEMGLAVYRGMTTFEETKIEAYTPQK